MNRVAVLWVLILLSSARLSAVESQPAPILHPAFPDHALSVIPVAPLSAEESALRESPAGPVDTEIPFSWDQIAVVRENSQNIRILRGFDPGFQPVRFDIVPLNTENIRVEAVTNEFGAILANIKDKTATKKEELLFRVNARDIFNEQFYTLTYDIRSNNTRIRNSPFLVRSPGDFVRPGQIVRYSWNRTSGNEKRARCEAALTGRTGLAKGLGSSKITEILAVKVRPIVLGHYLMLITPREVFGEPARGSTSNGEVFRCAFGSVDLEPVTDGIAADTFTPAVGQTITVQPIATDPDTGRTEFVNQTYDFGDGTVLTGITGAATHAYSAPGIYRIRVTVTDDAGLSAVAEDNVIVGPKVVTRIAFKFLKNIIPFEAGIGPEQQDTFSVTFTDVNTQPGDRLIFVYNRNRFGRINEFDGANETDIVLKGGFEGKTELARNLTITGGRNVTITGTRVQFDRTGDPRFGRSHFKGVFRNQRIALCVIPADGSEPRVQAYLGNVQIRVKGGTANTGRFFPEELINGQSTTKEPDPRKQEVD